MSERARPNGFDYSKPDPFKDRCLRCNHDGMNRTGLVPIAYIGTSTSATYGARCPAGCRYGLKLHQLNNSVDDKEIKNGND